jgi:hypothetical protein
VVLEDGQITGVGCHEELLSTSETYARFHRTNAEMHLGTLHHLEEEEEFHGRMVERAL